MYSNVAQRDLSLFTNNFEQILTLKFKFCNTKPWKKHIEFNKHFYHDLSKSAKGETGTV